MSIEKHRADPACFNADAQLPFELRIEDFRIALQDVHDFFHDVNTGLIAKGLDRLDDMLRPAIMSGVLSDRLSSLSQNRSRLALSRAISSPAS